MARISDRIKNYHVSEKKLSQEPQIFVTPKSNQLLPTYNGWNDSILEGTPKMVLEIIFFSRKKVVKNGQIRLFLARFYYTIYM